MRKLTVENFSVIKDAKLDFGKITVLIGPQSSGKSLLCKLVYFLEYEISRLAVDAILARQEWLQFSSTLGKRFSEWFPPEGWGLQRGIIRLESGQYMFEVTTYRDDAAASTVNTNVCAEFADLYSSLLKSQSGLIASYSPTTHNAESIWRRLMTLQNGSFVVSSTYIPAGRAFFTNASLAFAALQGPGIDPIIRNFALQIDWNSARSRPGLLTSGRDVTELMSMDLDWLVGGQVIAAPGGTPLFKTIDERYLPLHLLSSGTQELLPLVNILRRLAYEQEHFEVSALATYDPPRAQPAVRTRSLIYLEEPEAHVFPSTQYNLVKIIGWLAKDPLLDFSCVITTHSPYTLSSFNNLIYAGQLGQDKRLKKKIKIDERYWVEPGTFRAYSIHDGKSESILSDSGLIDGNYLDSVSEVIGKEFDDLLRLEYGKKKAS